MISPAVLTHIMSNFSTKQFFGEIPTHVFHYMSPREETPVGVTNHAPTARATFEVCSRTCCYFIRAKSGPHVAGGRGVAFGGYCFVYF